MRHTLVTSKVCCGCGVASNETSKCFVRYPLRVPACKLSRSSIAKAQRAVQILLTMQLFTWTGSEELRTHCEAAVQAHRAQRDGVLVDSTSSGHSSPGIHGTASASELEPALGKDAEACVSDGEAAGTDADSSPGTSGNDSRRLYRRAVEALVDTDAVTLAGPIVALEVCCSTATVSATMCSCTVKATLSRLCLPASAAVCECV